MENSTAFATAIAPAAFVSFALRFPNAEPKGAAKSLERFLLFVVSPLLVAESLFNLLSYLFAGNAGAGWVHVLASVAYDVSFFVGIVVLVSLRDRGSSRTQSLRWVVAALAVAYLPFLAWRLNLELG